MAMNCTFDPAKGICVPGTNPLAGTSSSDDQAAGEVQQAWLDGPGPSWTTPLREFKPVLAGAAKEVAKEVAKEAVEQGLQSTVLRALSRCIPVVGALIAEGFFPSKVGDGLPPTHVPAADGPIEGPFIPHALPPSQRPDPQQPDDLPVPGTQPSGPKPQPWRDLRQAIPHPERSVDLSEPEPATDLNAPATHEGSADPHRYLDARASDSSSTSSTATPPSEFSEQDKPAAPERRDLSDLKSPPPADPLTSSMAELSDAAKKLWQPGRASGSERELAERQALDQAIVALSKLQRKLADNFQAQPLKGFAAEELKFVSRTLAALQEYRDAHVPLMKAVQSFVDKTLDILKNEDGLRSTARLERDRHTALSSMRESLVQAGVEPGARPARTRSALVQLPQPSPTDAEPVAPVEPAAVAHSVHGPQDLEQVVASQLGALEALEGKLRNLPDDQARAVAVEWRSALEKLANAFGEMERQGLAIKPEWASAKRGAQAMKDDVQRMLEHWAEDLKTPPGMADSLAAYAGNVRRLFDGRLSSYGPLSRSCYAQSHKMEQKLEDFLPRTFRLAGTTAATDVEKRIGEKGGAAGEGLAALTAFVDKLKALKARIENDDRLLATDDPGVKKKMLDRLDAVIKHAGELAAQWLRGPEEPELGKQIVQYTQAAAGFLHHGLKGWSKLNLAGSHITEALDKAAVEQLSKALARSESFVRAAAKAALGEGADNRKVLNDVNSRFAELRAELEHRASSTHSRSEAALIAKLLERMDHVARRMADVALKTKPPADLSGSAVAKAINDFVANAFACMFAQTPAQLSAARDKVDMSGNHLVSGASVNAKAAARKLTVTQEDVLAQEVEMADPNRLRKDRWTPPHYAAIEAEAAARYDYLKQQELLSKIATKQGFTAADVARWKAGDYMQGASRSQVEARAAKRFDVLEKHNLIPSNRSPQK